MSRSGGRVRPTWSNSPVPRGAPPGRPVARVGRFVVAAAVAVVAVVVGVSILSFVAGVLFEILRFVLVAALVAAAAYFFARRGRRRF